MLRYKLLYENNIRLKLYAPPSKIGFTYDLESFNKKNNNNHGNGFIDIVCPLRHYS